MSDVLATRPHLVVAGWHRPGTGFTRVLEALVARWQGRARVTWVGIGARGAPRALAAGVTLVPVTMGRGDPVGAYLIEEHWHEWRPDAVFVLNDLWYLEHYARVLGPIRGNVPLVGYLPIDGAVPDTLQLPDLRAFSGLATFTHHAAGELQRTLSAQGQPVPVDVVGHGVDTIAFQADGTAVDSGFDPMVRARRAQALFGLEAPALVVLNASRADPRKRIDLTIDAFAVARARSTVPMKLCLHQAIAHEGLAALQQLRVDQRGLADDLVWWPPRPGPLDDEGLCQLYNACAIGLNTSMGEGFGLVSFEHAACGVPQVLPDHPALAELWGDAAVRVGPVHPEPQGFTPLGMAAASAEDIGIALAALVTDSDRYRCAAHAAWHHARTATFQWDPIAESLWALIGLPIS